MISIEDIKKVIKKNESVTNIINTIASNKNILKYTIKGIKKAIIEYKAKEDNKENRKILKHLKSMLLIQKIRYEE